MRYHVKNRPVEGWVYEEGSLTDVRTTNSLLARILIAKVEDEERLIKIFRSIGDSRGWEGRWHFAAGLEEDRGESKRVCGPEDYQWSVSEC
jgi:hypothetical protein